MVALSYVEVYTIAVAFIICTLSQPATRTSEFRDYLKEIITGRNEVLAKVIFSQACVCPQGGLQFFGWGVEGAVKGDPPIFLGGEFFFDFCFLWGYTPPPRPDTGIRSMFGRYASYWNAFLYKLCCCELHVQYNFFGKNLPFQNQWSPCVCFTFLDGFLSYVKDAMADAEEDPR